MRYMWWLIFIFVIGLTGCASKQYFQPEQRIAVDVMRHYDGRIVDVTRYGVTLDNGHYIGKYGPGTATLPKGYRFLNEDKRYVIASDAKGTLLIKDKKTSNVTKVDVGFPVIAAGVGKGLVGYVLENNTYGLIRIADQKRLAEGRSEPTFAIDARAAAPIFVDTLVVMPMLDGKLIIFDVNHPEETSAIYLSSDTNLNNVIFLGRTEDTLVAATPKKLLTVGDSGEFEKNVRIAEVRLSKKHIFLFTQDGTVEKSTLTLKRLAQVKFKFALFVAADVYQDRVYALDKRGSLIVLDNHLKKSKIYDVGEVETPVFMRGGRLYKDGDVIDLTALSYE